MFITKLFLPAPGLVPCSADVFTKPKRAPPQTAHIAAKVFIFIPLLLRERRKPLDERRAAAAVAREVQRTTFRRSPDSPTTCSESGAAAGPTPRLPDNSPRY